MRIKSLWKHRVTGTEGNCILFGVNIFNYKWNVTGEKVPVKDPKHSQLYEFDVYTIDLNGRTKRFAAGEYTNGIWGLYTERKSLTGRRCDS